ncbi:MAG: hypothetical protein JWQ72_3198 [Polaromonas sp.]|nr:hypothetical protein [Polaromonas sp.]
MLPEPTTTTIAALAAAASAISLALFGVDYYSLLYAFVGAMLAMANADSMGRVRAVIYVITSMMVGAVIGNAALAWFDSHSRALLFGGCLGGGLVAQVAAAAIVRAAPALAEASLTRLRSLIVGRDKGGQQ